MQAVQFVTAQRFVVEVVAVLVEPQEIGAINLLMVKAVLMVEEALVRVLLQAESAQLELFGPETHVRSQAHAQGIYK